ncbi:ATP-dependent DNA helicase PIF1-like protein [Tanacetum coccineum]
MLHCLLHGMWVLRNLDPANGLCNGTRLICKRFDPNVINAEIAGGQHVGVKVLLPIIPLAPSEEDMFPFKLKRTQFLVRLSFAMTINKAQEQTILNVGVYLLDSVFSHGQLYIALSRGISRTTTKIKAMKDLYLHDLNDMHHKILGKMQQSIFDFVLQKLTDISMFYLPSLMNDFCFLHDYLPQQPTNEQLEKLKVFKNLLERFMAFLQIPKQSILAKYKDKLGTYERQIVSIINSNRRKPGAPQQR